MVFDGKGTALSYSLDGTTWVAIDARVSIEGPQISNDDVANVTLDSTVKTTRPSALPDPGELTTKLIFDPLDTSHSALFGFVQAPAASTSPSHWKITLPTGGTQTTGSTFTASGYAKSFKVGPYEPGKNIEGDLAVKMTSLWTLTAGT
jgi:hypothetical protein